MLVKNMIHVLPEGLVYHCETCKLVIPVDAPAGVPADCSRVYKLSWFNPKETPAGQFIQAAATWTLIHEKAIADKQPAAVAYKQEFQQDLKAHFGKSALRSGLKDEHVTAGLEHKRDKWLYEPEKTEDAPHPL